MMIFLRYSRGKKKKTNKTPPKKLSSPKAVKCGSIGRKEFNILVQGHLTLQQLAS